MQPDMNPPVLPAPLNRLDWMGQLPPNLQQQLISNIVIPGTHDSGTAGLSLGGRIIDTFRNISRCQDFDIATQLQMGIRFLDIRVATDTPHQYSYIVHDGPINICCLNPTTRQYLTLNEVILTCVAFLAAHPNESIIMCIKAADGSSLPVLMGELNRFILQNPNQFYTLPNIPTLAQAQGRIVLIHRFPVPQGQQLGLDFSDWNVQAENPTPAGCFFLPAPPAPQLALIQDKYSLWNYGLDAAVAQKMLYFNNSRAEFLGLQAPLPLFLNLASCTRLGGVRALSVNINAQILAALAGELLGCVIMDFPNQATIDRVITSN